MKESQLKSNRFVRNYQNFKNTLLTKTKTELPSSPWILGNKDSLTEITIITNPFCGHCKNAHEILDRIIENHRENLKIKIIFRTDIDNDKDDTKTLYRNLLQIYLDKGEKSFEEALKYFFSSKNVQKFNHLYNTTGYNLESDATFRTHNKWCLTNGVTYTPAIFINGYEYPNSYEREHLAFFINEVVEDNF